MSLQILKIEESLADMRKALESTGIPKEQVEHLVKAHEKQLRKELLESADIVSTAKALEMVNNALQKAGLIKMTKDKYTIKNFRELIAKPNESGDIVGQIMPVDLHASKKTGFHFKKEEIEKFIEFEIMYRKTEKSDLFNENREMKEKMTEMQERISDLEKELESLKGNAKGTQTKVTTKQSTKPQITEVVLNGSQLTFTYNKKVYYADFNENGELVQIESNLNEEGKGKPVAKQTFNKLKEIVVEERQRLLESN